MQSIAFHQIRKWNRTLRSIFSGPIPIDLLIKWPINSGNFSTYFDTVSHRLHLIRSENGTQQRNIFCLDLIMSPHSSSPPPPPPHPAPPNDHQFCNSKWPHPSDGIQSHSGYINTHTHTWKKKKREKSVWKVSTYLTNKTKKNEINNSNNVGKICYCGTITDCVSAYRYGIDPYRLHLISLEYSNDFENEFFCVLRYLFWWWDGISMTTAQSSAIPSINRRWGNNAGPPAIRHR